MPKCYVGRCKCGGIAAAVVAEAEWMTDPAKRRHYETVEVAKDVAAFVREGLTIETMDVEQVRLQFGSCTCHEKTLPDIQGRLSFAEDSGGGAGGR